MRSLFVFIFCLPPLTALAIDDLTASQRIAAAGMKIQNQRLKLISQNIANSGTTMTSPDQDPYRRKFLIVKNEFDDNIGTEVVKADKIEYDFSQFDLKYEPHHPAADENGYVKYPNVKLLMENVDAKEAQRTFEANLSSMEISRSNQLKIIDSLGK